MSLNLVLVAIAMMIASGLVGLIVSRRSARGSGLATVLMVLGAGCGLAGATMALMGHRSDLVALPITLMGDRVTLAVDALSGFFLVPVLLMGALGSIYGLGYWSQDQHRRTSVKLRFFWGTLIAGMTLLLISRQAMVFMLGWEMMALSAFFLITTQDHRACCRQAGWIYFIGTHIGTLTLFALFALWKQTTGSYALVPAAIETMSIGVRTGLFFLVLFAFGLKAGMMPLHFWLPGAHANAPSHVSAILSGVVLKIGVYGLVRMLSLLPSPPTAWGGVILILATISALLGVVFAIGQHDLKRLLAYHSVENIGIILMGLGLAMLGRSMNRPDWVVLGMAGCLLHVWNHSFFKSLLFLCAGNVLHAAHTREIDRLGGLAKTMPKTALLFLMGAVAICGLPPMNGFVSELLVYMGLLKGVTVAGNGGAGVVLAAPVLAMVGALAVACFVKVYGAVFLGNARTRAANDVHEASASMRIPAMVLAGLCVVIGVVPASVVGILDMAIADFVPRHGGALASVGSFVPMGTIGVAASILFAIIVAIGWFASRQKSSAVSVGTWDCGYTAGSSRIQYTASSFSQMIVRMFRWVLRTKMQSPEIDGAFPRASAMHSHVDDLVLDRVMVPGGRAVEKRFRWFHRFQQGLTQHYVLYILVTVIVMLAALVPFGEIVAWVFSF